MPTTAGARSPARWCIAYSRERRRGRTWTGYPLRGGDCECCDTFCLGEARWILAVAVLLRSTAARADDVRIRVTPLEVARAEPPVAVVSPPPPEPESSPR